MNCFQNITKCNEEQTLTLPDRDLLSLFRKKDDVVFVQVRIIFYCCVTGSEYDALNIKIDGCTTAPCNIVAGSSTTVTSSFKAGKSSENSLICVNTERTSLLQISIQRRRTNMLIGS
jgi:hypothetical protein